MPVIEDDKYEPSAIQEVIDAASGVPGACQDNLAKAVLKARAQRDAAIADRNRYMERSTDAETKLNRIKLAIASVTGIRLGDG